MRKRLKKEKGEHGGTGDMFRAWFEEPLPYREAIEFYRYDRGWANRLVSGDSLLVMNSLLQKEGMAGQVQMIYIDPPYGIKYGSNFQPFVNNASIAQPEWSAKKGTSARLGLSHHRIVAAPSLMG
ncbi:hypothetical protein [Pseudoxanthomonas mexicana]